MKEDAEKGKDDIFKPKNKQPTFTKNLSEYCTEYSDNTSIHGVRYVGQKRRSILERSHHLLRSSSSQRFKSSLFLG